MSITKNSKKDDIWIAYQALKAEQQAQTITWPLVVNTARVVATEAGWLIQDIRKGAALAAQWISGVVDELNQPLLR